MTGFRPLRFAFAHDGSFARPGDNAQMRVTYFGRFNRKSAEADARRRFEEWQSLGSPIARMRAADQVVVD